MNLPDETKSLQNYSALNCSIRYKTVAQMLIEDARVELSVVDSYNNPIFLFAFLHYSIEVAFVFLKLLVSSGRFIHLDAKGCKGISLKEILKEGQHQEILHFVEEYESDREKTIERVRQEMRLKALTQHQRLIYACADGQIDQVKRLLSRKIFTF